MKSHIAPCKHPQRIQFIYVLLLILGQSGGFDRAYRVGRGKEGVIGAVHYPVFSHGVYGRPQLVGGDARGADFQEYISVRPFCGLYTEVVTPLPHMGGYDLETGELPVYIEEIHHITVS